MDMPGHSSISSPVGGPLLAMHHKQPGGPLRGLAAEMLDKR